MTDLDEYLSEDEEVVDENSDNYLTNYRLIKYKAIGSKVNYKDIQLDMIDSFEFKKEFSHVGIFFGLLFIVSGVTMNYFTDMRQISSAIGISGFLTILSTLFFSSREYIVRSASGNKISLDSDSDTIDFWKSVVDQRNSKSD